MNNFDVSTLASLKAKQTTRQTRQMAMVAEAIAEGTPSAIAQLAESKSASDRNLATDLARLDSLARAVEAAKKNQWQPMASTIKNRLGSEGVKYDPIKHKNTDSRHAWRFIPPNTQSGVLRWCASIEAARIKDSRESDKTAEARSRMLDKSFSDIIQAVTYVTAWVNEEQKAVETTA